MQEFLYEYMKPKYVDAIDLCYIDTDSFIYDIRNEDFYQDIKPDLNGRFDILDYKNDNYYKFPRLNKKVIGLLKDQILAKYYLSLLV